MLNLRNCDCMKLLKNADDNYYDLAIVDPPYGIDVTSMNMGSRKTVRPDKSKSWDSAVPDDIYFNELFRVSRNQIIWGGNYFNLPPSQYFAIWDKGESMYGRDFAECEFAWIKKGGTRIFKTNPMQLNRIHPTQKPVNLYKWLLQNYGTSECKRCRGGGEMPDDDFNPVFCTDCNGTGTYKAKILDTHGGSMSIAIACGDMEHDLTLCELDGDYFEAGVERVQKHFEQTDMFVTTPEIKVIYES